MLYKSLLLFSFVAFSSQAPTDDGMWHPGTAQQTTATAAAAAWGNTATAAAWGTVTSAATQATVAAQTAIAAAGDWQMTVIWPAGCDKWANPCPPGAKMSGGAVAGGAAVATGTGSAVSESYTNPFTSYTTMTNSVGVITGMPAKATVPAGVNGTMSTTLSTVSKSAVKVATTTTSLSASAAPTKAFAVGSSDAGALTPITVGRLTFALIAAVLMVAVL